MECNLLLPQSSVLLSSAKPRYSFAVRIKQYLILVRILLAEYRTSAFFQISLGFILPLTFLFFLRIAKGTMSAEQAIFIFGGIMATAIALGPTIMLINKIGHGRQFHEF